MWGIRLISLILKVYLLKQHLFFGEYMPQINKALKKKKIIPNLNFVFLIYY